jgi:hypothetical protein
MTENGTPEKIGTNLNVADLIKQARKSAHKRVPKLTPSCGFIRQKIINRRVYFYHVRTIMTPDGPRQKVVEYLGNTLPRGMKLGKIRELKGC